MVDIASIFMRALTRFLYPTVTLDLGQSIITHFSFKWKFSRLVISSIMHYSHLKDQSMLQLRQRWSEMFINTFFSTNNICNVIVCLSWVLMNGNRGLLWPVLRDIMTHTLGLIYCIIVFANATLVHAANGYWNSS